VAAEVGAGAEPSRLERSRARAEQPALELTRRRRNGTELSEQHIIEKKEKQIEEKRERKSEVLV
jgi:hypothetical protein